MTVVPVSDLGRHMPEAGRIRLGTKGSKGQPQKISTLRFTSENQSAIEEIANLYGGEARAWNPRGARHEFEVITTAKEVPIVLPPDPLTGTPIYELWSGGGLVRRCDGETTTVQQKVGADYEPVEVPCLCAAHNNMECKVTTRLRVVLPEIRFAGAWRLESHGWFAAKELPGMVEAIQALQAQGFTRAVLALEARTQTKNGKTRNFVVPVLRTEYTPDEIVDGVSQLQALAAVPQLRTLALPQPAVADTPISPDDEIAEAEIVEDEAPPSSASYTQIAIRARELGLDDDARHGFAYAVSEGRTSSTKELTPDECERILHVFRRIAKDEVVFVGVIDGRSVVKRKEPTTNANQDC